MQDSPDLRRDSIWWVGEDQIESVTASDEPPESEAAMTFSAEALKRLDEGLGGFSDREVIGGHAA